MKIKKITLILLSIFCVSFILWGCEKKENDNNIKDKSVIFQGKVNPSSLNYVMSIDPRTLDQCRSIDYYSSEILTNIMEGLTRLEVDENGNDVIKSAGAESWNVSDDGTVWNFKLRDMNWSDGKKVTVDDYIYGITRTLRPEVASPYAFLLFSIKNAEEFNSGEVGEHDLGVKKIDENTLQIQLKNPTPYFLNLTYFKVMYPLRKDIVDSNENQYGTESNAMVYSGPFIINNWVHDVKIQLTKNPQYWDKDSVKLDSVNIDIIKDGQEVMKKLYDGQLDLAKVEDKGWAEKLDATEKFKVKKGYEGSTNYVMFNQTDEYFKNDKIRKAFILATNREAICKAVFSNFAEPALGWCPPGIQIGGDNFRDLVQYNPIGTLRQQYPDPKELLIEGLEELGKDTDVSKIKIKYLQSEIGNKIKFYTSIEKKQIEDVLGVTLDIEECDWTTFQRRIREMDYQMATQSWRGDYNDPSTFFDMWVSTAGIVPTGWINDKYDELVKTATRTNDQEERTKLFLEAEKILVEQDAVISPITWMIKNIYVNKNIKDVNIPMLGPVDFKYTYVEK